ncbi:G2/mitotic-specific cyclin-B3-like isoform X1 [Heptranchias perlo]|uniref:G2/mitotic-specific cyclin-B3-like isoform X1 n=1 Tax=Heptranchias perlo TaxID=212740 RepID=UPI00355ABD6E
MSGAGFEPVAFQLGRAMKTRPAILRSSVKAAVTDIKQTALLENVSLSKRPIVHPQGPASKRTTCGDITNDDNHNTTKAPRKQPMRFMREAEVTGNASADSLNCFLQEGGSIVGTEAVGETQSPESETVSQDRGQSEEPVPLAFRPGATHPPAEEQPVPSNYAEDIFNYMTQREKHFALLSYMDRQPGINVHMRGILIDWMVEVQESYELNDETLYLAVKMVDRFLSKQLCQREALQLVGATSLLIAAKFEELCPLYVDDFLYICDDSYKREEILRMERTILQVLEFDINIPTAYCFLRHYAKYAEVGTKTLALARYICELTLQDYSYVEERASCLASACLSLAMRMDSPDTKPRIVKHPMGYINRRPCGLLNRLNETVREQPHQKLRVIYSKYSRRVSFEVAKIPALGAVEMEELVSGEEDC